MTRVKPILSPGDYPGTPDDQTKADIAALWDQMFPGEQKGEPHAGYAILAHSPKLALNILKMGDCILGEISWTQRRDLRELSVQALNLHYKCDFSFRAHLTYAQSAGISLEQQAAIPYWRDSGLFNDEQRLVIEYTLACVAGDVPAELYARTVAHFGDKGAIEFTVTIGWWSMWAMLLNATRPEFQPERSQPLPRDARELTTYSPDENGN